MKIQTSGNQAFNVPNDDEGRTFLRLMRKFLNRPRWRFRSYGRGPQPHWSVSQAQAEWIAVYLGGNGNGRAARTGSQFKKATLLSFSEDYQLWRLRHGGGQVVSKVDYSKHKEPILTPEEKDYMQLILETYEEGMESPSQKESEIFYGIFQKLVDI
jgi:hypothetical protein